MSVLARALPSTSAQTPPRGLLANSVQRIELLWRIAQAPQAPIVAAYAPAGYGKSTLLAQWAQSRGGRLAWVALSASENDPSVLAGTLAGALETVNGGNGEGTLVLDNVERVDSRRSLELLGSIVEEPPAGVRLGLASRNVPPLHLDRLLAARRALHLDASDLAMGASEAQELLGALGVSHDDGAADELVERTEGWPAAISLAAVSREALDRYIREEVLPAVQGDARTLAVRTAVLDELSGELCDAVLDRHGTGDLLRELEACGATLRKQDAAGVSYRWHPLVLGVLKAELQTCAPEEVCLLHRRAGEWFVSHGRIEEAIEHVCAAGDEARAGELLWEHAALFLYGRDELLRRWLAMFCERQIASDPALALVAAHSALALEDMPVARRWSELAQRALAHADSGPKAPSLDMGSQASSLRAGATLIEAAAAEGGVEQAASSVAQAQEALESTSPLWPLAGLLRGVALHLSGERDSARGHLVDAARDRAGATPLLGALSLAQLALMDVEDRAWSAAEQRVGQARAIVCEHGLEGRPACATVYAVSALVHSRRGLADEAKRELRQAAALLHSLGEFIPWFAVETRIAMARTSARLADVVGARALLSAASHGARATRPVPRLLDWLDEAWGELDEVGAEALSGPCALTMAELRVLRFLPTHLSFREIGERLHVSNNTVKTQAHAIYSKLDADSRTEAVAHAYALGLIDALVV